MACHINAGILRTVWCSKIALFTRALEGLHCGVKSGTLFCALWRRKRTFHGIFYSLTFFSVKKRCVCLRCLHWFKSTTYTAVIKPTLSFRLPYNQILFWKAGLYFARFYYCYYYDFNAWHSLLQCSFMQPLWKHCFSIIQMLFLCSFTHMNNLWHHNI